MKIIESPREGMQSLDFVIPQEKKIKYLNTLLNVGFDTVELGSIVSPKLIPQMADTLELLPKLDYSSTRSNRMMLVVNKKGAEIASGIEQITHISYPFSVSPTFLKLNLNTTIEKSMETVADILEICYRSNKQPVIYISMAFGNPYGDEWNMELMKEWVGKLKDAGVRILPLSNVAIEIDKDLIASMFSTMIPAFPEVEFGMHLHTTNKDWYANVEAAYQHGVRRLDGVINGYGGCPMSGEEMLGNLNTENIVTFMEQNNLPAQLDKAAFSRAMMLASFTFSNPIT